MKKRIAVCMYGMLRTYEKTSKSLIKHILEKNEADLFFYGPNNCGISVIDGADVTTSKFGNKKRLKAMDAAGKTVDEADLLKIYGDYLKKAYLYNISDVDNSASKYKVMNSGCVIPIERIVSMFTNISGTLKLAQEYSKENGITYDYILLIRPDLAFYSDVCVNDLDDSQVHVPFGGGILNNGRNYCPQYYSMYYKNVSTGELIEENQHPFTDQFVVSSFSNMMQLENILDKFKEFSSRKLPLHPETLMYYVLSYSTGHKVSIHNDWKYEIFRSDSASIENSYLLNCEQHGDQSKIIASVYDPNGHAKAKKNRKKTISFNSIIKKIAHFIIPSYRIGLINRKRAEERWKIDDEHFFAQINEINNVKGNVEFIANEIRKMQLSENGCVKDEKA